MGNLIFGASTARCWKCEGCPIAKYQLILTTPFSDVEHEKYLNGELSAHTHALLAHNFPLEWEKYWVSFSGKTTEFKGCDECVGKDTQARQRFTYHPKGWTQRSK